MSEHFDPNLVLLLVYHCNQVAGAKNKGIEVGATTKFFPTSPIIARQLKTPLRLSQTALPRRILCSFLYKSRCLEIFATMDDIAAIEAAAAVAAAAMSQQPPTSKFRREISVERGQDRLNGCYCGPYCTFIMMRSSLHLAYIACSCSDVLQGTPH